MLGLVVHAAFEEEEEKEEEEDLGGQQGQRTFAGLGDLVHAALTGLLIQAPTNQPGTVAETAAGEMIVTDLDDQACFEWLPFHRALGAPTA